MTANQIAYAKHLEESRHNRVSERHEHQDVHTRRQQAQTGWYSARETARHNAEQERVNWWSAQEVGRHNLADERTKQFSANALRDFQLNQSEALLRQAGAAERQGDVAYENMLVNRRNAATSEANTKLRSDELAASIAANNQKIALGYSELGELKRHQQETEYVNRGNTLFTLAEMTRHNQAQEAISSQSNAISAENAATNRRNATVNERNATTNEQNAETEKYKAKSGRISAITRGAADTSNAITRAFVALRGGGFIR